MKEHAARTVVIMNMPGVRDVMPLRHSIVGNIDVAKGIYITVLSMMLMPLSVSLANLTEDMRSSSMKVALSWDKTASVINQQV